MELHSEAAYDWYNSASVTKGDMTNFAKSHGVNLLAPGTTNTLCGDWADIAMLLFDLHGKPE